MAMHNPPHPGEFITEVYLEPNNLSGRELAAKVDVERDQRPARADDHCPRPLVQTLRPEVGRQLARIDPPLQLLRATAPEERRPAAGRELAVEEDGEAQRFAHPWFGPLDAAGWYFAASRSEATFSAMISLQRSSSSWRSFRYSSAMAFKSSTL